MYRAVFILSILFLWGFLISSANGEDTKNDGASTSNPNLSDGTLDYGLSQPQSDNVRVFDSFSENSCEVQKRNNIFDNSSYDCMSCKIIVSQTAIRATNFPRDSFESESGSEFFIYRFKLETETRYFCPDLDAAACHIKPVFVIKKKTRRSGPEPQPPEIIEGFELGIDNLEVNNSRIFLEIDIDHKSYEAFGYPDIVVEYVPTYTFEPNTFYRLSLSTLPKFQSTGLDAWDGLQTLKTPKLPSQERLNSLTDEEISQWPLKQRMCSDGVWCVRGTDCNMDMFGASNGKGVVKSFMIAVTICFLILWFFVVLVTVARSRVRKLSRRHGDTEYLYDEDDDLFDDDDAMPKRTNDTELLDLSKQQKIQLPSLATETTVHFKDREKTPGDSNKRSQSSSGDFQSARIEVNSGALHSYPNIDNSEDLIANVSVQFATSNID